MKSRQEFEGSLTAIVKERILKSTNKQEEAIFLIDTFMAASFFLVGVVERNASTERGMNCMFARAQRVRELIEKAKRNPQHNGTEGLIQG